MTFTDLPRDWAQHSVTDAAVFLDIVDLIVTEADRVAGALYGLLCGQTGRLMQPCAVGEVPSLSSVPDKRRVIGALAQAVAGVPGGGLVVVVARPGRPDTTDEDREWHEAAEWACREWGARLLAVAVATPARIWRLADAIEWVESA